MGVTWISYRRKHELDAILLELGLELTGTVEDQRSRLYAFVRQPGIPHVGRQNDQVGIVFRRHVSSAQLR